MESNRKISIWERVAEENLYQIMQEMNNTFEEVEKFQKSRCIRTCIVFCLFATLGVLYSPFYFVLSLVASFMYYIFSYTDVKHRYSRWVFHRRVGFLIFIRDCTSLLLQNEGNKSLYSVFDEILRRPKRDENDQKLLYQLVADMRGKPADVSSFLEFASKTGGDDMAELSMTILYSYHHYSSDTDVIYELSQTSSEEIKRVVSEIIELKSERFNRYYMLVSLGMVVTFILPVIVTLMRYFSSQFYG